MNAKGWATLYVRVRQPVHDEYKALADSMGVSLNQLVADTLGEAFPHIQQNTVHGCVKFIPGQLSLVPEIADTTVDL